MKKVLPPFMALASAQALAHDGHGLIGSHWHSSDAWGFVALAVLALAVLFTGRGK